jgi:hypothetical protein
VHSPSSPLAALLLASCGGDDGSTEAAAEEPAVTVVRFGTSFGMCLGPCDQSFTVDGNVVTFEAIVRNGPTFTVEA